MNWKIVAAFVAGAVLASGIVYLAVRPASSPQIQTIADVRPASEAPVPAAPSAPAPETSAPAPPPEPPIKPPSETAPKPEAQHARLSHTPIREKPSPMPPVHRETLPVVARNQETVEAPAPAPAPPVNPEPAAPQSATAAPTPAPPTPAPPTPAPPAAAPAPEPAPAPVVAKVAPEPEVRVPHSVVLTAGTPLVVRMGETVSAAHNQVGDTFFGTLEQQLVIDGFIIGERGARVIGRVSEAVPSGRGGGMSHLSIELVRLSTSDGQRIPIRTEPYVRQGSGSAGGDLAKIGAGAAIGAAIGAIAGGGKGAAIGAGAGAAAGTGAVLVTNGKSVEIPVETRVTFHVKESTTLTEKLD